MARLLDVSTLPGGRVYTTTNGHKVNFGRIFHNQLRSTIVQMMELGLVKMVNSFGFAMAEPGRVYRDGAWDDPSQLVWMTGGWGPEKNLYVANAARKLRLAVREGHDSLGTNYNIDTPVESKDADGYFPWGDFPWGGAVWADWYIPGVQLVGAVSALTEQEDDIVARMILGVFGLGVHQANHTA